MNHSKQKVANIFHQLDRRLKSADEKSKSEVRDEMGEDAQKKRNEVDSHPDNKTSSTTITVYVQ